MIRVPEPKQAGPCRHCYGRHPDETCPHEYRDEDQDTCQGCGKLQDIDDSEYCMECHVTGIENQGYRWGEDR